MNGPVKVLAADDDSEILAYLGDVLSEAGMAVRTAEDGQGFLEEFAREMPDIVLLDVELPDTDGLDLLATIRRTERVPVIIVSGRGDERDRVRGLELGADDYLVKPFSGRELVARIHAVLRRTETSPPAEGPIVHGDLVVDPAGRVASIGDRRVELTRREFDLLSFLVAHPGRAFSREELLERVWSSSGDWQGTATVTEHVRRLRLKLEPEQEGPVWIHNVRGVGYRFDG